MQLGFTGMATCLIRSVTFISIKAVKLDPPSQLVTKLSLIATKKFLLRNERRGFAANKFRLVKLLTEKLEMWRGVLSSTDLA